MRIYRVGGWVRDSLLGYQPKDSDFVVVGATTAEFLKDFPGAQQIGKSFPVFLVREDGWQGEFAFARRERKIGLGHSGFEVEADPTVTLEEDLARRDLTINAIALPHVHRNNPPLESQVIDPFGGVSDLRQGVLRHVTDAFREDPLRVYRLARFAAKTGFVIDPQTYRTAQAVPWEEILALSGERVWGEDVKALASRDPARYYTELAKMKVLGLWHRELMNLINVPAGPPQHHGEGDSFTHTMMVLEEAARMSQHLGVRFAALLHDLGKGITPKIEWPAHHDHDIRGVPLVEAYCKRLHVPNFLRDCAVVACREHMRVHKFTEMRKGKMVDLVKSADRTQMKAEGLAFTCQADSLGRLPSKDSTGARALEVAARASRAEDGHPIPESLEGEHIGLHIRNKKGTAVQRALKEAGLL